MQKRKEINLSIKFVENISLNHVLHKHVLDLFFLEYASFVWDAVLCMTNMTGFSDALPLMSPGTISVSRKVLYSETGLETLHNRCYLLR